MFGEEETERRQRNVVRGFENRWQKKIVLADVGTRLWLYKLRVVGKLLEKETIEGFCRKAAEQ